MKKQLPRCVKPLLGLALVLAVNASSQEVASTSITILQPRDMNRYHKIGIRYETYTKPLWRSEVDRTNRYPSVIVNSPELHFPPVEFQITPFPDQRVGPEQIRAVALAAMKHTKTRYGRKPIISSERFLPRSRGVFHGFETTFDARVEGVDLSVLYFVGRRERDGRVISMLAKTQHGRLPHIKDHIRRTFDWVDYVSNE